MKNLLVVGDGWGAISVVKGLLKNKIEFSLLTKDEFLVDLSYKHDIVLIDSFEHIEDHLILFAGYKLIISQNVIEKNDCLNIHYSLLPQYRGFHSTVWAILNDECYLGLTIHRMDQYIDNGDIVYQYRLKNQQTMTSSDFMVLFNEHIENVISQVLIKYDLGVLIPIKQDKKQASWVGKRSLAHCKIDFNQSISYLKNFFRAHVSPYPLPFVVIKNIKYIVTMVDYHYSAIKTDIGRVLNIDEDGMWVKCYDGYLIIKELQSTNGDVISLNNFKIGIYVD